MWRLMISLVLCASVSGVHAQEPVARDAGAVAVGNGVHAGTVSDGLRNDLERPLCIRDTGSRLAPRPGKGTRGCLNVPGRSYSQEDLRRTGASNTADALRMLDPAIH